MTFLWGLHSSNKSKRNLFMKLENIADKTRDKNLFFFPVVILISFSNQIVTLYVYLKILITTYVYLFKKPAIFAWTFLIFNADITLRLSSSRFFADIKSYSILMDDHMSMIFYLFQNFEKCRIILCVHSYFLQFLVKCAGFLSAIMNLLLYQLPNITILPLQEMLWLFPSLFVVNNFLPKTRKTFLVHELLPESFFVFSKIQNLQSVFKPLNARF